NSLIEMDCRSHLLLVSAIFKFSFERMEREQLNKAGKSWGCFFCGGFSGFYCMSQRAVKPCNPLLPHLSINSSASSLFVTAVKHCGSIWSALSKHFTAALYCFSCFNAAPILFQAFASCEFS